ncbi:MAG: carbonic anhydrase [Gemmatimonadota bacterium]
MPTRYDEIFERNRAWVAEMLRRDPDHFHRLAERQEPTFLFIGCSDSRVPANVITGTGPGEMFVHRNIANLVVPTDFNVLSVIEYAVGVLGVRELIVCGHQGCGGVRAAMGERRPGLVDHWLDHIRAVIRLHQAELDAIPDEQARYERLVELNVMEQVRHLRRLPIVQSALAGGIPLRLHGLVYDIRNGLLRELEVEPVPVGG